MNIKDQGLKNLGDGLRNLSSLESVSLGLDGFIVLKFEVVNLLTAARL